MIDGAFGLAVAERDAKGCFVVLLLIVAAAVAVGYLLRGWLA